MTNLTLIVVTILVLFGSSEAVRGASTHRRRTNDGTISDINEPPAKMIHHRHLKGSSKDDKESKSKGGSKSKKKSKKDESLPPLPGFTTTTIRLGDPSVNLCVAAPVVDFLNGETVEGRDAFLDDCVNPMETSAIVEFQLIPFDSFFDLFLVYIVIDKSLFCLKPPVGDPSNKVTFGDCTTDGTTTPGDYWLFAPEENVLLITPTASTTLVMTPTTVEVGATIIVEPVADPPLLSQTWFSGNQED